MHNQRIGQKGEDFAHDYLQNCGQQILNRNYRFGKGEIDIITLDKNQLVFIEVKTRLGGTRGRPLLSIHRRKQTQMIFVANAYIQSNKREEDVRFDVITIIKRGERFELEHIRNAFYPIV